MFYNLNTTNSDYKFSWDATTYKAGCTNINPNLKNQGNQGNMSNPPNLIFKYQSKISF